MTRTIGVLIIVAGLLAGGTIAAAQKERSGKDIYEGVCKVCHEQGVMNAPKLGDKKWTELAKKEGLEELVKDAIKGEGNMPPRGGCNGCTDGEIRAAVKFLIDSAAKK